jgi:lipoprotein-releasing system permease protein
MYKLLLCTRYLRTRYIALASIISVTLGVATMIVVNSVMAGFGTEMRDRIRGILSHIVVDVVTLDGTTNYEAHQQLIQKVAGEYIDGMTPTVEIYGMLSFQFAGQWITRPVTLIGIDPVSKAEVGPLVDYLQSYQPEREEGKVVRAPERTRDVPPGWELTASAAEYRREWSERQRWFLEQLRNERDVHQGLNEPEAQEATPGENGADAASDPFAPGAAPPAPIAPVATGELLPGRLYVGQGLISFLDDDAGRTVMMAQPGDDVKISTVTAGRPPEPAHFNATIVDVFKSGMSEYDSSLIFCNLEYLQQVRGMIDPSTGSRAFTSIQIKLKDYRDADEVVQRLKAAFPPGMYSVRTWEQKQGPLLAAVEVESAILNVLLFLIIAVAGFGILAIFFMIVVEKTRDIGILKALGASSNGVLAIFLSYGLSLGIVGSGVGAIAGLLFVHYINEIEAGITFLTGHKVFDERIYYFPVIPTHVDPAMVVWVALGAMLIAVLASILPARRAASLHPVQALRYE